MTWTTGPGHEAGPSPAVQEASSAAAGGRPQPARITTARAARKVAPIRRRVDRFIVRPLSCSPWCLSVKRPADRPRLGRSNKVSRQCTWYRMETTHDSLFRFFAATAGSGHEFSAFRRRPAVLAAASHERTGERSGKRNHVTQTGAPDGVTHGDNSVLPASDNRVETIHLDPPFLPNWHGPLRVIVRRERQIRGKSASRHDGESAPRPSARRHKACFARSCTGANADT